MSAKDVLIDLEFTQKRLTKQHINGYHAWAILVVKGLRKGKFIKLNLLQLNILQLSVLQYKRYVHRLG